MNGLWRNSIWNLALATPDFRGKERLLAMAARPSDLGLVQVRRSGVDWALQGYDLNEFYLAVRHQHSAALSDALLRCVQTAGVSIFWDIGANIGAVSLPLLQACPQLRAVLFEPSAEVAGRLMRNLGCNPALAERASVMNLALSDTTGLTPFFVSGESNNSGVGGLAHSANRAPLALQLQAFRGDELVAAGHCAVPQLIKIDVEGFEIEVFKGLADTLSRHHPTIVFEHSVYRFRERQRPLDEVVQFLRGLGYGVCRLGSGAPVGEADLQADADFIASLHH